MSNNSLHIRELNLKVTEMGTQDAESLARSVVHKLGEDLPAHPRRRRLGKLSLKVELPEESTRENAAESIARSIRDGLR